MKKLNMRKSMLFGNYGCNGFSIDSDALTPFNRATIYLSGERGNVIAEIHVSELKEMYNLIGRAIARMEKHAEDVMNDDLKPKE